MSNDSKTEDEIVIYRAWRRGRDGEILYAKDYGLRAWRIVIRKNGRSRKR